MLVTALRVLQHIFVDRITTVVISINFSLGLLLYKASVYQLWTYYGAL